jgi:hypothetical protein
MSRMSTAVANNLDCCVYCKPTQLLVNKNISDGIAPVSATPLYFRKATVLGVKSLTGTNNVNAVKIGWSSAANQQPYVVATGTEIVIEAVLGAKLNFADLYMVVATDGDGLVFLYQ